ncbi:hypothetical protein CA54_17860 [Symmachiella macrocystis]|uniref:FlgN protein n=1 Tax=Symmachiella macrocystis TaxID=2527985 RepID=A0A5C6BLH2_9PLAN|nr:hypothetical protein [Symmachiella macrocystis]TWU12960.1 hypothetical protein CA54_17860 [Symmachiella macrocystis]
MTGSPTFNFVRIFAAHRECCSRLLELSHNQDRLIIEDDYTQLLVVLGKKQKVLNQMEEYAKHRPRIQALWKLQRDELDTETRRQCEDLLNGTESDLAELVRQEQASTDRIEERRAATQQDLQNLDQGGRVSEAYRDSLAPATHRRLDIGQ